MVKHIVQFTLKEFAEGGTREENARKIKAMMESLNGKVDGMRHLEVGIDASRTDESADIVIYSEFDSWDALDGYQNHPEHLRYRPFIKAVRITRGLADYEV